MTNEPEWVETFRRKWEGANTGGHNAISTPVMDEMLSDIQDTIDEEREKKFASTYRSSTSYLLGFEDGKRESKAELLSKIEEEVEKLIQNERFSGAPYALNEVIKSLSKYKVNK
jgi:hypothetical protein